MVGAGLGWRMGLCLGCCCCDVVLQCCVGLVALCFADVSLADRPSKAHKLHRHTTQ